MTTDINRKSSKDKKTLENLFTKLEMAGGLKKSFWPKQTKLTSKLDFPGWAAFAKCCKAPFHWHPLDCLVYQWKTIATWTHKIIIVYNRFRTNIRRNCEMNSQSLALIQKALNLFDFLCLYKFLSWKTNSYEQIRCLKKKCDKYYFLTKEAILVKAHGLPISS